jgi:hypothetical protein
LGSITISRKDVTKMAAKRNPRMGSNKAIPQKPRRRKMIRFLAMGDSTNLRSGPLSDLLDQREINWNNPNHPIINPAINGTNPLPGPAGTHKFI